MKNKKEMKNTKYKIKAVAVLGFMATEIWYPRLKSMVLSLVSHVSLDEMKS